MVRATGFECSALASLLRISLEVSVVTRSEMETTSPIQSLPARSHFFAQDEYEDSSIPLPLLGKPVPKLLKTITLAANILCERHHRNDRWPDIRCDQTGAPG